MKKKILTMLVSLMLLVGCSSSKSADPNADLTLSYNNGVISYNDTPITITEHKGYSATIQNGTGGINYNVTLDTAKDVTNITINTQGILEENMDKLKDKFYYTEYLGTKLTMAQEVGQDTWKVCQVVTNNLNANLVATYVSEVIDNTPLTNGQLYVDFGSFIFGSDYDQTILRTDCALISGVAKVSQGTHETTTTVSIIQDNKEYQVQKGSSKNYDYYVYDGYVIQLASGLDFNTYIKFK